MKLAIPFTMLSVLWLSSPAFADGLLLKLPDDGAWVKFDMDAAFTRNDQEVSLTGDLLMSSVGKSTEDGKACRWIEVSLRMKNDDTERRITCKVLVPESELKEGGDPLGKRVRGLIQMGSTADIAKLQENNIGPMPTFLAKELSDKKKLAPATIDSKLGKEKCEGVAGTIEWKEGKSDNRARIETRRHPKAPFGVVASKSELVIVRDGQETGKGKLSFRLTDFGFDAKSKLPDNN